MANAHITAAFRCSKFKGITRLVLLYLADAASSLSAEQAKSQKKLPFGYCKRKHDKIMVAVNCYRQPTISACLSELKDAGAIKQFRKKHLSALYFVDLEWLKSNIQDKHPEMRRNTLEPHVSAPSDTGEDEGNPFDSIPAGDPRFASGMPALGMPYDNENHLVLSGDPGEKRLVQPYENRLHSIPSLSHPPSSGKALPTASRDKTHAASEHFVETPSVRPGEPGPVAPTSLVDLQEPFSTNPVQAAPPAQAIEIPAQPVLPHKWPPFKERRGDSVCLRPGCGVLLDDWRYQREKCQGEEDSAHA